MQLTSVQIILTVLAVALGAIATRLTPFVLFPDGKRPPEVVTYLGNVLPPVMMGLLVVYCLKSVPILSYPHGLPELISIAGIYRTSEQLLPKNIQGKPAQVRLSTDGGDKLLFDPLNF